MNLWKNKNIGPLLALLVIFGAGAAVGWVSFFHPFFWLSCLMVGFILGVYKALREMMNK